MDVTADPFGTTALRAGVLAAWADSPTRVREDANAEEDLRLGGYADTWCVELAQNAADAARAAGVPGRVRIAVERGELRVANTGVPLDAAGVAALAALRASAKRDDAGSVGRFGVGFAAVLALSDAPRIVTAGAGVAFSAASTAEAVRELSGPAAELARRDGQLPVLRLVWPTGADEPPPPAGYATEVRLPLCPGVDPDELLAAATAAAPDLLLALPDLVEIDIDGQRFGATALPGVPEKHGIVEIGAPD
ncbi:MAG: sacsin N-terminal ATP-binding-like domain-containing protein, partial [Pseudonocardia sp.]